MAGWKFAVSLLDLINLDWYIPDYSTVCLCEKTPVVIISYKGLKSPLHLLIDNTGINVKVNGMPASIVDSIAASDARFTLFFTKKD
jgi:hypothetical protein